MQKNRKKSVLFTKGISDEGKVKVASVRNGQLIYSPGGSSNLYNHIKTNQFEKNIIALDTQRNQVVNLLRCDLIFNQVSDPDTHKKVLHKLDALLKRSKKEIYCFNHPLKIFKTSRDNIYTLLHQIPKLIVPKTIKINPKTPKDIIDSIQNSNMELPVLFRQAGDHGGVSTVRIESLEDIEPAMYSFALDGREYYLTEFYDYKEKGVYKKLRLVVVNGEVYIRHVIFSNHWMIHSRSREFMDKNPRYNLLEMETLENFNTKIKPLIKEQIREIHQILQLDYFGIDCNINKDGEICIFELNANMNVLSDKGRQLAKYISIIEYAVRDMIIKRLEKI